MNTAALMMLMISTVFLWGGLLLSLLHLWKHPDQSDE